MDAYRFVDLTTLDAGNVAYHAPEWRSSGGRRWGFVATDDRTAAAVLVRIAEDVASQLTPGTSTAVLGRGTLGGVLSRLGVGGTEPPVADVVIDTTGDHDQLDRALAVMAPLARLIVPIPLTSRRWDLDLYPEVHRRGLVLQGRPWPPATGSERSDLVTHTLRDLVGLDPSVRTTRDPAGRWFRVSS